MAETPLNETALPLLPTAAPVEVPRSGQYYEHCMLPIAPDVFFLALFGDTCP